jgi:carboxymethylenebutenolidase
MSRPDIDSFDGGRFGGYLAEPSGDGPVPAVIVILEIRGVNANLRTICDGYAALGYLAVAPDLLWRIAPDLDYDPDTPAGWDLAMKIHAEFDEAKAVDDLKATLAWMRRHKRSNGVVGTVGFCLGGKLAYLMATRTDVDAAVGYYGVGIDGALDQAGAITHPLMLHVAGEDRFVPKEAQERIARGLASVPGAAVHIYPGADHAFARKDGVRYMPQAAALADARTVELLARCLRRDQGG